MVNLVDQILKQADLINDLERIVKLNIDDEAIEYGSKALRILEKLKERADSIVDKNAINDLVENVRNIMQMIQDTQEGLYVLQQRLVEEGKLNE